MNDDDTRRRRRRGCSALLSVAVLVGFACGDDTTVTTTGQVDTESTTGTVSTITLTTADTTDDPTTGVDTTDTASTGTSADSTSTTGDDTTTTGGEVLPGQTINQLVSAGERTASGNYTLIYTFGQPSQLQSTHDSANYRIRGGLIGANGSPP